MKTVIVSVCLFLAFSAKAQWQDTAYPNIFLITIDGYRWQELFNGADSTILANPQYVSDTIVCNKRWYASTTTERRQKLMPFFWQVIASQGSLYGNRAYQNKVDVANLYKFSYPGYNEILTGKADIIPIFNTPTYNTNNNILSILNNTEAYKNKTAAFCSWNILKYILNPNKAIFPINAGFEEANVINEQNTDSEQAFDELENNFVVKERTRWDDITFIRAKQYILNHKPKLMMIGFGETDEFAHHKRYDLYLQQANKLDNMIAELWYMLQDMPEYKNNCTFIITTDHGRGKKQWSWPYHCGLIKGSGEAWLAVLGTGLQALGEVKNNIQLYQKQLASTIASLAKMTIASIKSNPIVLPSKKILPTQRGSNILASNHNP